jgi:hypothetical protein
VAKHGERFGGNGRLSEINLPPISIAEVEGTSYLAGPRATPTAVA